jgi:hypothetical protein
MADLKFVPLWTASYIVGRNCLKIGNYKIREVGLLVVTVVIARLMVDTLMYYSQGASINSLKYLSVDTIKALYLIIPFYGVGRLVYDAKWDGLIFILLGIIGVMLLHTRWLLLTLMLGMVIMVLISPKAYKGIAIIAFVLAISISFPAHIYQGLFEKYPQMYYASRRLDGLFKSPEQLDPVRMNAITTVYNSEDGNVIPIILGNGYASSYGLYVTSVRNLNESAFDNRSLAENRYYRVHDFVTHFILKYGVFGLLLYLASYFKHGLGVFQSYLRKKKKQRMLAYALAMLPTIITYMWFSTKGIVIAGCFLAYLEFCHKGNIRSD